MIGDITSGIVEPSESVVVLTDGFPCVDVVAVLVPPVIPSDPRILVCAET